MFKGYRQLQQEKKASSVSISNLLTIILVIAFFIGLLGTAERQANTRTANFNNRINALEAQNATLDALQIDNILIDQANAQCLSQAQIDYLTVSNMSDESRNAVFEHDMLNCN